MESLSFKSSINGFSPPSVARFGHSICGTPKHVRPIRRVHAHLHGAMVENTIRKKYSFPLPLRTFWVRENRERVKDDESEVVNSSVLVEEERTMNWVMKILQIKSIWKEKERIDNEKLDFEKKMETNEQDCCCGGGNEWGFCDVDGAKDDEMEIDRDTFVRFLKPVSAAEMKVYVRLSYLGNLAYYVPKLKHGNYLRRRGFKFISSSTEKKLQLLDTMKEQKKVQPVMNGEEMSEMKRNVERRIITAKTAYRITASAASYLISQTRNILPFPSSAKQRGQKFHGGTNEDTTLQKASFMATTDSVTAVVAAKEEEKQAVARDLSSANSPPCDWFICDDEEGAVRYFVIQGSETLASWQANLLFEPARFENLDVLVHRGIYEAAKGIFEQMLPEVQAHLKSHGSNGRLRFTGHSLGGSLSLLVNLMLLIRGEAPKNSLLPVVTFGAPSIMCGGDYLLQKLGLPPSHLQAVMLHRDIVPRAFSCTYPDHVTKVLKAINGSFRDHPCLNYQKLLYAPMGELLILQPDPKISPNHSLLPPGQGLYVMPSPQSFTDQSAKKIRTAQITLFNSPHPLETLSDRDAYGPNGSIYKNHDTRTYSQSLRKLFLEELKRARKAKREKRQKVWWHIVIPNPINHSIFIGIYGDFVNLDRARRKLSGILKLGKDSLSYFGKMVIVRRIHLVVLMLLPLRLFLLVATLPC